MIVGMRQSGYGYKSVLHVVGGECNFAAKTMCNEKDFISVDISPDRSVRFGKYRGTGIRLEKGNSLFRYNRPILQWRLDQ